MAKIKVFTSWTMCATVEIEADSEEEAIAIVASEETPLPENAFYLEDSFRAEIEKDD